MATNSLKNSIFLCILLQFNAFNIILAQDEEHIPTCKISKDYGVINVELICSNEVPSVDIFTNTSLTETIVCVDDKAMKINSINSISFTNCIYRRAPIHLFNHFPLQTIDLQSTTLERLGKYDFVDAPYLKKLIVINNSLTTIPPKLFKFAPAIESLFLSHNQISVIDPQAFNTTHRIKFLDLSNNHLTKVSKSVLDMLPDLESLYLSKNSITEIDPSAFSGITRLDALDLDGNKLETLTSNMFEGLWWAFRLDLSSNNIKRIERHTFSALERLMTLQLNSNAIDSDNSIQPNAFHGLKNVCRLEMNHNKLTILRNGMFDGIRDLQYLELHDNQIVAIELLPFNHIDLHDLDLSSNQISALSSDVFSHAPNMQHVNLSNTNIAEIKEGFLSSASKLNVFLSFSKLKSIDFNHLSHFGETLRSLYVDGNELTELHSDIREILPKLSDLGLTNNNFSCSYFREIYPTIGAKLLSTAIKQHPVGPSERNVHGIRCY